MTKNYVKKYISDVISTDYRHWGNRKILIVAPTGMGKTTFILRTLLPYLQANKCDLYGHKKMLILCNRKLLRMQYWQALLEQFDRYTELEETVEVRTYQQLSDWIREGYNTETFLVGYSTIVCDEAHYFYADSDFNGLGTVVLLQALLYAGLSHQMLFLTATAKEIEPLLLETLEKVVKVTDKKGRAWTQDVCNRELKKYDFSYLEDFSRFECVCIEDEESLCEKIGMSAKKSILFIDDIEAARRMAEQIKQAGNLRKDEIGILYSGNLNEEENTEIIQNLVLTHKCRPQVLITTSVLDNGVSIEDEDVGNIVIITESPISFLQMLGRVRAGYSDKIQLIFLLRPASFFKKRKEQYQSMLRELDLLKGSDVNINRFSIINAGWKEDEQAKLYRRLFIPCPRELAYLFWADKPVTLTFGDTYFAPNKFAKEKIGNMYCWESKFYKMALEDPIKVIYEQMEWMDKKHNKLVICASSHREQLIVNFIRDVLQIKEIGNSEFSKVKEELSKKYRKELFSDIVDKNGGFSTDKFEKILERYGCELISLQKNGKKTYTVKRKEKENERNESAEC